MTSQQPSREAFALWERFGYRYHIVATLVTRADGIRWRALCGLDLRRRAPALGRCGYSPACSAKKTETEARKALQLPP